MGPQQLAELLASPNLDEEELAAASYALQVTDWHAQLLFVPGTADRQAGNSNLLSVSNGKAKNEQLLGTVPCLLLRHA